jgi:hypothetical protein
MAVTAASADMIVGELPTGPFASISFVVPDAHGGTVPPILQQDTESYSFTFVGTGGPPGIGLDSINLQFPMTAAAFIINPPTINDGESLTDYATLRVYRNGSLIEDVITPTGERLEGSTLAFGVAEILYPVGVPQTITVTTTAFGYYQFLPVPQGPPQQEMAGLHVDAGVSGGGIVFTGISGNTTITIIPEPETIVLIAAGLLALLIVSKHNYQG